MHFSIDTLTRRARIIAVMKSQDPMKVLLALLATHGTQQKTAAALDIHPSFLCDILKGRRGFSDHVLAKLGLERIITVVYKKAS